MRKERALAILPYAAVQRPSIRAPRRSRRFPPPFSPECRPPLVEDVARLYTGGAFPYYLDPQRICVAGETLTCGPAHYQSR